MAGRGGDVWTRKPTGAGDNANVQQLQALLDRSQLANTAGHLPTASGPSL